MGALNPKVGEVLNITTFTHIAGNMQISFKRPSRDETWVFLLLGTEKKGEPMDVEARLAAIRGETTSKSTISRPARPAGASKSKGRVDDRQA